MEWKNHYNQHTCTALEAVDGIKDNYKLVYEIGRASCRERV